MAKIFSAYSAPRRDKKSGRLLSYANWEACAKAIGRSAGGHPINFELPSFRVQQFAFFTSKEMFPQDGALNELNWPEFKMAIARLGYKMVQKKKPRGIPESQITPPPLSEQCQ